VTEPTKAAPLEVSRVSAQDRLWRLLTELTKLPTVAVSRQQAKAHLLAKLAKLVPTTVSRRGDVGQQRGWSEPVPKTFMAPCFVRSGVGDLGGEETELDVVGDATRLGELPG
jgi:hypothetical protein